MLNIEITIKRGELDFLEYDPELQRRLMTYMEEHPEAGMVADPKSLYRRLMDSQKQFLGCIREIFKDETQKPYTVTFKIEGEKTVYPPGTARLY